MKMKIKVTEYNNRNAHSMSNINLYKVILEHFSLALTVFQIHFKFHDFDNVGQRHDVQHLQRRYMMATP